MKKKMFALAALGIILIAGGGIGAALNFRAAEKQITTVTNESYAIKDKQNQQALNLSLELESYNHLRIEIVPSHDDQFHLKRKSYNSTYKPKLTWTITEKKGQTNLALHYEEKKQPDSYFNLSFWNDDYSPITLEVPSAYENMTVTSASSSDHSLSFSDLTAKKLAVTNPKNSSHFYSLQVDDLSATSESGDIILGDLHASNEITLLSDTGEISLNDVTATRITSKTVKGGLHFYDVVATSELESEYGEFSLSEIVGSLTARSIRGDIYVTQDKLKDALDLSSDSGNIEVRVEKKTDKLHLTAETSSGDLSLFGDTSLAKFKAQSGPTIKLTTNSGDITLASYEDNEYDEEFEDDWEDDFE